MTLAPVTAGEVRIGVAIGIPDPHGAALVAARVRLGEAEAADVPPHITLVVPASIGAGDVAPLDDHLAAAAARHAPFVVQLRGSGTFRPVSPVVFVQVARGISACEQLEADVRRGPLAQALRFPYHPHVTVAQDVDDATLDLAYDDLAGFEATFVVSAFHRYEHEHGAWRPARTFALTGMSRHADAATPTRA